MAFLRFKKFLGGVAEVDRDEWSRILPLSLAYGLVMASLYVLKPARNALFLDRIGIDQLPYVLVMVALVGGVVAVVFTRLARQVRLDRLILGTFLFLMTNLLAFWYALPQGHAWIFYLFYIWVNLYGLLATALLWLLANALFNARQARRLFGIIGSAGITGAILGGAFTGWIVKRVGTENLLLICLALLGVCLLLLYVVRTRESAPRRGRESGENALTLIGRSDLLRLLGSMAALTAVVAAVVDIQFNSIVDQVFTDKDAKTAFFGEFFAYLSICALIFQVLLTGRILRSMGVIWALLVLPLSMAAGSLAVLFFPGALLAGILVKTGDGGLRHSIHKSAVEILYLPISPEVKKRTKVLLDTTVDNLATGLGALIVIFFTTGLGLSYQYLSVLSLLLVGVWLALVLRGRSAYVDGFRRALERREIEASELTIDFSEAAVLDSLIASLESGNERQVVYALDMLVEVRAARLVAPVHALLGHTAAEVRYRALRVLANQEGVPLDGVEVLVEDDDLEVRIEALHCLCVHGTERYQRLQQALQSGVHKTLTAAMGCIAAYGTEEEQQLIDGTVVGALAQSAAVTAVMAKQEQLQAAQLLGRLERADLHPHLQETIRQYMESADPDIVEQTILSLGQLKIEVYYPWLLEKLKDRDARPAARQSLAAYGVSSLKKLAPLVGDEEVDLAIRSSIPRIVSAIPSQEAVDLLLDGIERADPQLDFAFIKGLSKLRGQRPELNFDRPRIEGLLQEVLRSYFDIIQVLNVYTDSSESAALKLLHKALSEKQEQNVERIFRLLGLLYDPQDMHHAYLGYVSGDSTTRGSALELLDNVLERVLKELVLPLLDAVAAERVLDAGRHHFGIHINDRQQALQYLLESSDPWLRACAVFSVGIDIEGTQASLLQEAQDDPHPVVRETVQMVLRRAAS